MKLFLKVKRPTESAIRKAVPNIRGTYHYRTMPDGKRKRFSGKRLLDTRSDGHPSWQKISAILARPVPSQTISYESGAKAIERAKQLFERLRKSPIVIHGGAQVRLTKSLQHHIFTEKGAQEAERRARYFSLLLPTLKNPIEVWQTPENSFLYLSAYEQEDDRGVIHDTYAAVRIIKKGEKYRIASFVVPARKGEDWYVERRVRRGKLIYREE